MNIFYLDTDPTKAAQYMTDRHVVKMILESAQLLSTAHRVLDGQMVETKSMIRGTEDKPRYRKHKLWILPIQDKQKCIWLRTLIIHPLFGFVNV